MPLVKSKSEPAFKQNVKTLMHEAEAGTSKHVKSRAQALAVAYSIKRRGRRHGGRAYDYGGFVNPAAAPVSGPTNAVPPPATPLSTPLSAPATYSPPPAQGAPPQFAPPPGPTGGFSGLPAMNALNSMAPNWSRGGLGEVNSYLSGLPGFSGAGERQSMPMSDPAMSGPTGGFNQSGGSSGMNEQPQGFALGGAPVPWQVRAEARQMMHTGPIPSIVPGRTDRHGIKVPSGSYVLPADHVSSLGQGNTHAGYAVLNKMFSAGPLGGGKIARGPGAPHPPKMMGIPSDTGGARGDEPGKPTDVIVAGGEFVLSPEQVMQVGQGSLKNGHAILDAWVKANRQQHIKVLKGLPPPAKS